ncbi:hypothetical protein BHU61_13280 (plasmid) [Macrococcus epidermidis]|uniref:Uncharacterized protein n=1 Tax=Macrococcus epidermidis TaxID=1902580 RepID=A0A327ZPM3_9STAP|nr:hypothetical protein [Macrococcus epidermidis]RAK43564.1 hypothetical protein BHU61_13280 [Macrococcus epidermidis]
MLKDAHVQMLVKSIKEAIKKDFKTNSDVLETGAISLTDALNGATSDNKTLKDAISFINEDKRFRFFTFYDEKQADVIRYERYEEKAKESINSDQLVKTLGSIIAKVHELEDENNLAYVLKTTDGFIVESIDDSYSLEITLI